MESAQRPEESQIVTIDGPAGAGKSTVSKMLARNLNFLYLDTGAMYRAVALQAKKEGIDSNDEQALEELCRRIEISFREGSGGAAGHMPGRGRNRENPGPGDRVDGFDGLSRAARPRVHGSAAAQDRAWGAGSWRRGGTREPSFFPGRNTNSFCGPIRGREPGDGTGNLVARGLTVSLEEIEREVRERDEQDSSRSLAPLRPAEDARIIDSTGLGPEEVVERIGRMIEEYPATEAR